MSEARPTDHVLLVDITNRLSVIESKLDIVTDHEERIRELEKARYSSAWLTSILSASLTAGVVALVLQAVGQGQ